MRFRYQQRLGCENSPRSNVLEGVNGAQQPDPCWSGSGVQITAGLMAHGLERIAPSQITHAPSPLAALVLRDPSLRVNCRLTAHARSGFRAEQRICCIIWSSRLSDSVRRSSYALNAAQSELCLTHVTVSDRRWRYCCMIWSSRLSDSLYMHSMPRSLSCV